MKSPLEDRESRRNSSAGEENIAMNRNSILIIILSVVVVVAAIAGLVVNLGSKGQPPIPAARLQSQPSVSMRIPMPFRRISILL